MSETPNKIFVPAACLAGAGAGLDDLGPAAGHQPLHLGWQL